jgi:predicted O-linked N-acetylglucosamine transferase (SPINDLY family)
MLRRYDDALASYDKGLLLAPNSAQMHCNRGNTLYELKRYGEALSGYDKALSLKPNLGDAMVGRGNVLADLQRYDEAFAAYDSASSLDSALENAWLGRANSLYDQARLQESVSTYDKALALKPDLEAAWLGRGNALYDLRRFDEAFAAYDKAFVLNPDLPSVEGARLNAKMMLCDWRRLDDECRHVVESVRGNRPCTAPFAFLAVPSSHEDQFQCAKTWVAGRYPKSDNAHWSGKSHRHGKIRIGYVSSDLCEHATSYLMAGVFEHHDRSRFETAAFSVGPDDRSELRKRLERSFDGFHDVRSFTDDQIASEIATAEIDILVDLNGFTRNSRTAIFARRPAPIQASYLGYPGTMGAEFIDYIVGDPTTIPDAQRNAYSEKIIHLPHSYQANDDARLISEKTFTRTECGLPQQGFVFCCFNNSYKIMPSTFDIWMRLLARVDGSVLWLFQDNETASNNLRRAAAARGVNPDRLIFATRLPMSEHLARHRVADLFLDTLPYNAHTTASDALWAGLPVLTRVGETFAGRVAASLLKAIGLPDLIAQTADEYERQAFGLATQPDRLADIRARLEANRRTTPLFDTRQFTRHIERAYEIVQERQQSGLAPEHIHFAD